MKKIYLTPEMEIIEVKAQQTLLTGSVPMYNQDATGAAMAPEYEWADWEF